MDIFSAENNVQVSKKLPKTFDSAILYSIVALYYIFGSQLIANIRGEIILVVSEIIFLALPPLLLALIRGYDIKTTFRLKAPKPLEVLLMLGISPFMIIAGFCAGMTALVAVRAAFGRVYLAGEINTFMAHNLFVSLFLVAVVPAVCEEFLFRGMIQRGLERLGAGWGIFLSGILFGLFHFDFQRLAAQTLVGLLSAYVVYRTGSIFNGMILHFMNNGLVTLLVNLVMGTGASTGEVVTDPFATQELMDLANQAGMSLNQLLGLMSGVFFILFIFCLLVIMGLLTVLRSMTKSTVDKTEEIKGSAKGLLAGIPGLLIIIIVYVSLGLTLMNNDLGQKILKIFELNLN
ncbi:MAG: CPBP family intramembrane metalloprotease [Clostridiaceae bacterium]|nr:CPBP family intramembrane metalloprotease [Clostridiaceae bacterium]